MIVSTFDNNLGADYYVELFFSRTEESCELRFEVAHHDFSSTGLHLVGQLCLKTILKVLMNTLYIRTQLGLS